MNHKSNENSIDLIRCGCEAVFCGIPNSEKKILDFEIFISKNSKTLRFLGTEINFLKKGAEKSRLHPLATSGQETV